MAVGQPALTSGQSSPLHRRASHGDIFVAMTAKTPPANVVRFDIRSIPKKPPAPSVRRRVKVARRARTGR